jgi:pimeloyl-ACP methyl ester carboxylesterase
MGIWTTYGEGRFAAGDADTTLLPTEYALDGSRPGVVYCHPSGGTALSASDPISRPGEWNLVRGLAEHYPTVVANLGGPQTFGNDLSVSRVGLARQYLQSRWGARPGPIVLVAVSMGAGAALRYAAAHPGDVAAVVAVAPLLDLDAFYSGDVDGLASLVAAAWGVSEGAPLPATANPMHLVDELRGIAFQGWTASDDESTPAATLAAFVEALGSPAEAHALGPLGHTEALIAAVPVAAVVSYIEGATALPPALRSVSA